MKHVWLGGGFMARFGYLTYSRGRITLGTLKRTMLLSAPRTSKVMQGFLQPCSRKRLDSFKPQKLKGIKGWKRK